MEDKNSAEKGLDALRKRIDLIDSGITRLFVERMDAVTAIGRYKLRNGLSVLNKSRERIVLDRAYEQAGEGMGLYTVQLFETVMKLSRSYQDSLIGKERDAAPDGRVFGLVGRKLGHSWSCELHEALGCSSYRLYELEPDELADFISREDIGGLNVTIPYKRDAYALCGELSEAARGIGSVNTVVRRDGVLYGDNTDIYGFDCLAKRAGISFDGKKTVILGSGGASLTAQYYARTHGASEVVVVSRSGEDNYENLVGRHRGAQVIVNATPVGMFPNADAAPVDLELFPECEGVIDMIYNPYRTRLVMQAERLGIRACGGLAMLAAQAAAAQRVFGRAVPERCVEELIRGCEREKLNIVLIGMPGCGKTTVGAALSGLSGREPVDTDAMVESEQGMSVPEIFSRYGEAYFREREHAAVERAGAMNGVIITTGGGAVLDEANYAPLRSNGVIYHIERPLSELARDGRPLSGGTDMRAMYAARIGRYEHFRDAVFRNLSPDAGALAGEIFNDFLERCGSRRNDG